VPTARPGRRGHGRRQAPPALHPVPAPTRDCAPSLQLRPRCRATGTFLPLPHRSCRTDCPSFQSTNGRGPLHATGLRPRSQRRRPATLVPPRWSLFTAAPRGLAAFRPAGGANVDRCRLCLSLRAGIRLLARGAWWRRFRRHRSFTVFARLGGRPRFRRPPSRGGVRLQQKLILSGRPLQLRRPLRVGRPLMICHPSLVPLLLQPVCRLRRSLSSAP